MEKEVQVLIIPVYYSAFSSETDTGIIQSPTEIL